MPNKKSLIKKYKNLLSFENLKDSSAGIMLCPVNLEIKGNREVIVEGCKSISLYDENIVKVKMNKMSISFFGRKLEIKYLTSDSLIIRGFITSIEFIT